MTIDYSKYEGHTAGPWEGCGMVVRARIGKWGRALLDLYHRETEAETLANRNLIADATLLLKRCRELEAALRFCLNVVEKGIEVRMEDRWPTLRDVLPEAKSRARSALGMDEVTK